MVLWLLANTQSRHLHSYTRKWSPFEGGPAGLLPRDSRAHLCQLCPGRRHIERQPLIFLSFHDAKGIRIRVRHRRLPANGRWRQSYRCTWMDVWSSRFGVKRGRLELYMRLHLLHGPYSRMATLWPHHYWNREGQVTSERVSYVESRVLEHEGTEPDELLWVVISTQL